MEKNTIEIAIGGGSYGHKLIARVRILAGGEQTAVVERGKEILKAMKAKHAHLNNGASIKSGKDTYDVTALFHDLWATEGIVDTVLEPPVVGGFQFPPPPALTRNLATPATKPNFSKSVASVMTPSRRGAKNTTSASPLGNDVSPNPTPSLQPINPRIPSELDQTPQSRREYQASNSSMRSRRRSQERNRSHEHFQEDRSSYEIRRHEEDGDDEHYRHQEYEIRRQNVPLPPQRDPIRLERIDEAHGNDEYYREYEIRRQNAPLPPQRDPIHRERVNAMVPNLPPAVPPRQFWFFFDDWQQNPAKNAIEYIMRACVTCFATIVIVIATLSAIFVVGYLCFTTVDGLVNGTHTNGATKPHYRTEF